MPEQFLYLPPQEYAVSRRRFTHREPADAFAAHHGYVLLYVEQGTCRLDLGDRTLLAEGGSVLLLAPGRPYKTEACGTDGASVLTAEFSAAGLQPLAGIWPDCDLTVFLESEPVRQLSGLPAAMQRDICRLLEKQLALCALPASAPGARSEGLLLLAALLLELERVCISQRRNSESGQLAPLLRRYIAAHYTEKLDLTVLATRFHVSRWHLCHAFKAGTGQSPIEYLNRTRVQAACVLLQGPEPLTLEQVAGHCGFSGLPQLRRLFRQETGMSPREYRRQMQGQ